MSILKSTELITSESVKYRGDWISVHSCKQSQRLSGAVSWRVECWQFYMANNRMKEKKRCPRKKLCLIEGQLVQRPQHRNTIHSNWQKSEDIGLNFHRGHVNRCPCTQYRAPKTDERHYFTQSQSICLLHHFWGTSDHTSCPESYICSTPSSVMVPGSWKVVIQPHDYFLPLRPSNSHTN